MMTTRRTWVVLAAATVVGVAAGAAWPPPPLSKLTAGDDGWSLPSAADILRHVPQDMAAVTNGMRWKGDAGSGEASGEKTTWRLAGIVNEAGPAILVMTPDKPGQAQRIEIGGSLPDGSLLLTAGGDQASTKRDACITTYQLFHAQPVEKSNGCEEPEAPAQGTNE